MDSKALKNIRTLDYVILLCEDIPSMKTFYHEIMGFQIYREDGKWVEMKIGASLFTLRKRGRPRDFHSLLPGRNGIAFA